VRIRAHVSECPSPIADSAECALARSLESQESRVESEISIEKERERCHRTVISLEEARFSESCAKVAADAAHSPRREIQFERSEDSFTDSPRDSSRSGLVSVKSSRVSRIKTAEIKTISLDVQAGRRFPSVVATTKRNRSRIRPGWTRAYNRGVQSIIAMYRARREGA